MAISDIRSVERLHGGGKEAAEGVNPGNLTPEQQFYLQAILHVINQPGHEFRSSRYAGIDLRDALFGSSNMTEMDSVIERWRDVHRELFRDTGILVLRKYDDGQGIGVDPDAVLDAHDSGRPYITSGILDWAHGALDSGAPTPDS